jgi:hypothetical protein
MAFTVQTVLLPLSDLFVLLVNPLLSQAAVEKEPPVFSEKIAGRHSPPTTALPAMAWNVVPNQTVAPTDTQERQHVAVKRALTPLQPQKYACGKTLFVELLNPDSFAANARTLAPPPVPDWLAFPQFVSRTQPPTFANTTRPATNAKQLPHQPRVTRARAFAALDKFSTLLLLPSSAESMEANVSLLLMLALMILATPPTSASAPTFPKPTSSAPSLLAFALVPVLMFWRPCLASA